MTPFAEAVNHGDIVEAKELGLGKTGAVKVTYDSGQRGLMKVQKQSRVEFRGVPKHEEPLNEVAAYLLDQNLFKFNVVPEVVLASVEGHLCSVQNWVEGKTAVEIVPHLFSVDRPGWKTRMAEFFARVPTHKVVEVIFFDLLVNNTDRHARNIIFMRGPKGNYSDGRVVAIDNGGIFGQHLRYYRNVYHKYMFLTRFDLPQRLIDLAKGLTVSELEDMLAPVYRSPRSVRVKAQHVKARATWVVRHAHELPFFTVSKQNMGRNEFPSYYDEIERIINGLESNNTPLVIKTKQRATLA